jgi:predicted NAD-dependent protein-ADP-ribosyltransferase YbiA (DUF1768 family)
MAQSLDDFFSGSSSAGADAFSQTQPAKSLDDFFSPEKKKKKLPKPRARFSEEIEDPVDSGIISFFKGAVGGTERFIGDAVGNTAFFLGEAYDNEVLSDFGKDFSTKMTELANTGFEAPDPRILDGWKHPVKKSLYLIGTGVPQGLMLALPTGLAGGAAKGYFAAKNAGTAGAIAAKALKAQQGIVNTVQRIAGSVPIGTVVATGTYKSAREAGLTHNQALAPSFLSGVGEAYLEFALPLGLFVGPGLKGKNKLRRLAAIGITESAEEVLQGLWTNVLEIVGWKGTEDLYRDLTHGLLEGGIAGFGAGAVLGLGHGAQIEDIAADQMRKHRKAGVIDKKTGKPYTYKQEVDFVTKHANEMKKNFAKATEAFKLKGQKIAGQPVADPKVMDIFDRRDKYTVSKVDVDSKGKFSVSTDKVRKKQRKRTVEAEGGLKNRVIEIFNGLAFKFEGTDSKGAKVKERQQAFDDLPDIQRDNILDGIDKVAPEEQEAFILQELNKLEFYTTGGALEKDAGSPRTIGSFTPLLVQQGLDPQLPIEQLANALLISGIDINNIDFIGENSEEAARTLTREYNKQNALKFQSGEVTQQAQKDLATEILEEQESEVVDAVQDVVQKDEEEVLAEIEAFKEEAKSEETDTEKLDAEKAKAVSTTTEHEKPEPMNFKMPAKDNIWGEATTTFKEIVNGRRTSTSRGFWFNGIKNINVGDIMRFQDADKSSEVKVRVVKKTQITPELAESPEFQEQWSKKEGWTIEAAKKKGFLKGWQVEFELMESSVAQEAEAKPTILEPLLFEQDASESYVPRTRKNASADATIAIAVDFTTGGERATVREVKAQGKKFIKVDARGSIPTQAAQVVKDLNEANAKTLNIAGNGIQTLAKNGISQEVIDTYVENLLTSVVNDPTLKNKITLVRSGGQTGADEAGIKAAIKLGIPAKILAPKGWRMRGADGEDTFDEQAFKDRFKPVIEAGSKLLANAIDAADTPDEKIAIVEHLKNTDRSTPDLILKLAPNEVVVFGSNDGSASLNKLPTHGAGMALTARKRFGAIQGQARGLQGQSYAIVTKKDFNVKKSSTLEEITAEVEQFKEFARQHPELTFLVTKLGTNLAGYTVEEMAPLFAGSPVNVVLPQSFKDVIGIKESPLDAEDKKAIENFIFKPKKKGKTVVHFGKGKNVILSNFADAPFRVRGQVFRTAEGAYQALKSGAYVDGFETLTGPESKRKGQKLGVDKTQNLQIMREIIQEKLFQVPEFRDALLDAGTITHPVGDKFWAKNFPLILEEAKAKILGEPVLTGDISIDNLAKVKAITDEINKLPEALRNQVEIIEKYEEVDKGKEDTRFKSLKGALKNKGITQPAATFYVQREKMPLKEIKDASHLAALVNTDISLRMHRVAALGKERLGALELEARKWGDYFNESFQADPSNLELALFNYFLADVVTRRTLDPTLREPVLPQLNRVVASELYNQYYLPNQGAGGIAKKYIKMSTDRMSTETSDANGQRWELIEHAPDANSDGPEVKRMAQLSCSTWCTSRVNGGFAHGYVLDYENHHLIVKGKPKVGISLFPPGPLSDAQIQELVDDAHEAEFEQDEENRAQPTDRIYEITNINNDGVASLDYLDETIAKLKEVGVTDDEIRRNRSLQLAREWKDKGYTDVTYRAAEDEADARANWNRALDTADRHVSSKFEGVIPVLLEAQGITPEVIDEMKAKVKVNKILEDYPIETAIANGLDIPAEWGYRFDLHARQRELLAELTAINEEIIPFQTQDDGARDAPVSAKAPNFEEIRKRGAAKEREIEANRREIEVAGEEYGTEEGHHFDDDQGGREVDGEFYGYVIPRSDSFLKFKEIDRLSKPYEEALDSQFEWQMARIGKQFIADHSSRFVANPELEGPEVQIREAIVNDILQKMQGKTIAQSIKEITIENKKRKAIHHNLLKVFRRFRNEFYVVESITNKTPEIEEFYTKMNAEFAKLSREFNTMLDGDPLKFRGLKGPPNFEATIREPERSDISSRNFVFDDEQIRDTMRKRIFKDLLIDLNNLTEVQRKEFEDVMEEKPLLFGITPKVRSRELLIDIVKGTRGFSPLNSWEPDWSHRRDFRKNQAEQVEAYYDSDKDKVVIVAENIKVKDVKAVVIHEVTHRGIYRTAKAVGGVKEIHDILSAAEEQLMKAAPELLARTGHNSIEELIKDYGFEVGSVEGRVQLLGELAARWSERFATRPTESWFKKLLTAISQWVKQFTGATLTERETDRMVSSFVMVGANQDNVAVPKKSIKGFFDKAGVPVGSPVTSTQLGQREVELEEQESTDLMEFFRAIGRGEAQPILGTPTGQKQADTRSTFLADRKKKGIIVGKRKNAKLIRQFGGDPNERSDTDRIAAELEGIVDPQAAIKEAEAFPGTPTPPLSGEAPTQPQFVTQFSTPEGLAESQRRDFLNRYLARYDKDSGHKAARSFIPKGMADADDPIVYWEPPVTYTFSWKDQDGQSQEGKIWVLNFVRGGKFISQIVGPTDEANGSSPMHPELRRFLWWDMSDFQKTFQATSKKMVAFAGESGKRRLTLEDGTVGAVEVLEDVVTAVSQELLDKGVKVGDRYRNVLSKLNPVQIAREVRGRERALQIAAEQNAKRIEQEKINTAQQALELTEEEEAERQRQLDPSYSKDKAIDFFTNKDLDEKIEGRAQRRRDANLPSFKAAHVWPLKITNDDLPSGLLTESDGPLNLANRKDTEFEDEANAPTAMSDEQEQIINGEMDKEVIAAIEEKQAWGQALDKNAPTETVADTRTIQEILQLEGEIAKGGLSEAEAKKKHERVVYLRQQVGSQGWTETYIQTNLTLDKLRAEAAILADQIATGRFANPNMIFFLKRRLAYLQGGTVKKQDGTFESFPGVIKELEDFRVRFQTDNILYELRPVSTPQTEAVKMINPRAAFQKRSKLEPSGGTEAEAGQTSELRLKKQFLHVPRGTDIFVKDAMTGDTIRLLAKGEDPEGVDFDQALGYKSAGSHTGNYKLQYLGEGIVLIAGDTEALYVFPEELHNILINGGEFRSREDESVGTVLDQRQFSQQAVFTGEKFTAPESPTSEAREYSHWLAKFLKSIGVFSLPWQERIERFLGPRITKTRPAPQTDALTTEEFVKLVGEELNFETYAQIKGFEAENVLRIGVRKEVIDEFKKKGINPTKQQIVERTNALGKVMWRGMSEFNVKYTRKRRTGTREPSTTHITLTDHGLHGRWQQGLNGVDNERDFTLKDIENVLGEMGIEITPTQMQDWHTNGLPPLFWMNQLPTRFKKWVLWTKGNIYDPVMFEQMKEGVFARTDMIRNRRRGFVNRAFDFEDEETKKNYFNSLISTDKIFQREYRTDSEFVIGVGLEEQGKGLVPIDNLFQATRLYVSQGMMRTIQSNVIGRMKNINNPEHPGLGIVAFEKDLPSHIKAKKRWFEERGYVQLKNAPGLTEHWRGSFQVPWVTREMANILEDFYESKQQSPFLKSWLKLNGRIKRFIMFSPYQFAMQIVSSPLLWSNPGAVWKHAVKPVVTGELLWRAPVELIAKAGKGDKFYDDPFEHFDNKDYDPETLDLFLQNGLSSFMPGQVFEQFFNSEHLKAHPDQRSELEDIATLIGTRGGIDNYVFNHYVARNMYEFSKILMEKLQKTNGMSKEEAAKQAVQLVNNMSGMLSSHSFGKEGDLLQGIFFARNFTWSFFRQLTGATYPLWREFHGYKTGKLAALNSILHSDVSKADMDTQWKYYLGHLARIMMTKMVVFSLLQWALMSWWEKDHPDEVEEKDKWTHLNYMDPGKFGMIKTPFKTPDQATMYIDPLVWREMSQFVNLFPGLGRGPGAFLKNKLNWGFKTIIEQIANADHTGRQITDQSGSIPWDNIMEERFKHVAISALPAFAREFPKASPFWNYAAAAGFPLKRGIPVEPGQDIEEAVAFRKFLKVEEWKDSQVRDLIYAAKPGELKQLLQSRIITPEQYINALFRRQAPVFKLKTSNIQNLAKFFQQTKARKAAVQDIFSKNQEFD